MLRTITDRQVLGDAWKTTYDDIFHYNHVAEIFEIFDDRNSAEDIAATWSTKSAGSTSRRRQTSFSPKSFSR